MKKLIALMLLSIALLAGCNKSDMPPAPEPGEEGDVEQNDDDMMIYDNTFRNKIVFENVSKLEAQGEGFYGYIDGETRVMASFMIEQPEENYFYEGWMICGGKAYSTGQPQIFEGIYETYFVSFDLPQACEQYILTLESPDNYSGKPSTDHIMEGEIQGISHLEEAPSWDQERFMIMAEPIELYACDDNFEFTMKKSDTDKDVYYYVNPSDGVSIDLIRTEAASGEKFLSDDGTLAVWFKGEEAMVLGGEDQDVMHSACTRI